MHDRGFLKGSSEPMCKRDHWTLLMRSCSSAFYHINNLLLVWEVRLEAEVDTSFGSFSPSSLILVKHWYGDTRAVEDHHPTPVTCKDINGRGKHITLWVIIALSFTHRNFYNKANSLQIIFKMKHNVKKTVICPLAVTASASILS